MYQFYYKISWGKTDLQKSKVYFCVLGMASSGKPTNRKMPGRKIT